MKISTLRAALLGITFLPGAAMAQSTINFSTSDAGVTKSVATWGVDTAWPSYDNVRLSVANMGQSNVDEVRVTFHPGQALFDNGNGTYSLNATSKGYVDAQLSLATMAGTKPLTFVPGELPTTYDSTHWIRTIKATQEYINSKTGWTTTQIKSIEAFNEPDYWAGEGNAADLNYVISQLKTYPVFQNTSFPAASTLNSNNAQSWYNQVPQATAGSSHLLGGSLTSYVNFIANVQSSGKPFYNPELHSLGEAIIGADRGMTAGTWWADVLRARGLFVQASDGKRLGYAEDISRQSAAAVYRGNDGKIRAFAGGLERFGTATSYKFVSSDTDVFFNGIPVRQYVLQTKSDENASSTDNDFQNYGSWSNQGAYADVDTTATGMIPALDGYRWKIVNVSTGQVMEVADSSTSDGALIRTVNDNGGLNQQWNIIRTRNGYYELFNAASGKTAEIANGSLNNGASVRQWGTADNIIQQWTIDDAGSGAFYLRNGNSGKYVNYSASNNTQTDLTGTSFQKWKFVLANPTTPAKAQYQFQGSANDSSANANHATAFNAPTFGNGPTGTNNAIVLDGSNDYVQLPATVANSTDITVSTWVKWNGGNNWQRIFDFGNNTSQYMFLTPKSGDNTMRFGITRGSNGAEQKLDTAALPTGQWVHLTLTLGGQTAILYINGKPQVAGQIQLDPSFFSPTLNYIGKSQWAGDPTFNGSISDFRIYDYALHLSQVASLVNRCWTGSVNSNWTTAAQSNPKNWLYNLASTDYANGDTVMFNDYATNFSVNITEPNLTPGNVVFDNSINSYSLSGSTGFLGGSTSLTKTGLAELTINNAHFYTGGTFLNGGTLNIHNASAIGTGPLTIAAGTTINNGTGSPITLSTNNAQVWNGDFTFIGIRALNMGTGTVTMTGDRTITVFNTGALTVGPITESGGSRQLTKSGPGTLILNGASTYTGNTNVTGGRLTTKVAIQNGKQLNITTGGVVDVPLNGSATGVTSLSSLTISGSGSKLQLHDNDLILNYGTGASSYNATVNLVKAGLTLLGGTGTTGITSAEVDSQTIPGTMLAVVDDGNPLINGAITALSGFTIPNPTRSVLVKYTWFGDSNLDGIVDGSDYALIDTGFTSGGTLTGWVFGDYDYNGIVDGSDYALIDTGFTSQTGALPEPVGVGVLGLLFACLVRRTRK